MAFFLGIIYTPELLPALDSAGLQGILKIEVITASTHGTPQRKGT